MYKYQYVCEYTYTCTCTCRMMYTYNVRIPYDFFFIQMARTAQRAANARESQTSAWTSALASSLTSTTTTSRVCPPSTPSSTAWKRGKTCSPVRPSTCAAGPIRAHCTCSGTSLPFIKIECSSMKCTTSRRESTRLAWKRASLQWLVTQCYPIRILCYPMGT